MGKVSHLFRAPKRHESMEELSEAVAMSDAGFEGCSHELCRVIEGGAIRQGDLIEEID